jgi:hypothetical protein
MTVALVWTLLVWSPVSGGHAFAAVDGLPTKQHCDAMANEVARRHPGLFAPRTACIQRQMVVASK